MLIMPNGQPSVAPQSQQQYYNVGDFQNYLQQGYGKQANQEQLNKVGQRVGQAGPQGYSRAQFDQAKQFAEQEWGKPQQQQSAPVPAGVPPAYQQQQFSNPYKAINVPQFQQTNQVGKFVAPNDPNSNKRNQLMGSILGNANPFNQQWQDQMFEQQKEQANSMSKQLGQQQLQDLGGRGFSLSGGQANRLSNENQQQLLSELLGARRNVATQATEMGRQAELQAMQMAQQSADSDMNRALQGYQGQLAGAANVRDDFMSLLRGIGMQDDSQRAAAGLDLNAFGANQQSAQAAANSQLQNYLAGQSTSLERDKFNSFNDQFKQTFGLDLARFAENNRQFNTQFGENQRQFNNNMGLNWFNSQNNQQQGILDFFARYFGG